MNDVKGSSCSSVKIAIAEIPGETHHSKPQKKKERRKKKEERRNQADCIRSRNG
jgi:hypothetical protein